MKLIRNLFVLVVFLGLCSGVMAQKTCALRVIDQTPTQVTYTATIKCYYNNGGGNYLTCWTINKTVTPNTTNDIALPDLPYDTDDNDYILEVYVLEPGSGNYGPFYSSWFNYPYFYNNNIPVLASF